MLDGNKYLEKIIRQKNRVGMENGEIFNIVARKGSLISEMWIRAEEWESRSEKIGQVQSSEVRLSLDNGYFIHINRWGVECMDTNAWK